MKKKDNKKVSIVRSSASEYLTFVASSGDDNDSNLSASSYVEQEDTREKIDITELNKQIFEIVAREQVLRDEIDKIIAEIEV